MITENHLKIERTARYYSIGDASGDISEIWYVLHGYGQLARYFIRNFESIAGKSRLIIAPEGLSRFYLSTDHGRVGATWMTREDRLNEIDDYLAYLDLLHRQIIASLNGAGAVVKILGFSQGTATASRWAVRGEAEAAALILWAGSIPPELDFADYRERLDRCQLHLAIGRDDEYIKPELVAHERRRLDSTGISYEIHWFDGKHVIDRQLLEKLAVKRDRSAG